MAKPIGIPFRRGDLWLYPLVPIPLAVMFTSSAPTWQLQVVALLGSYLFNFIVTVCMGGLIHAAYVTLVPAWTARIESRALQHLVQALVIGAGVLLGAELALFVLGVTTPEPLAGKRLQLYQIGLAVSVSCVLVLQGLARLRQHIYEVELRKERAETRAVRAQLAALRARTNPHFLFNSLNSVAGLVSEDPQAAETMLERMAAVFRHALAGRDRDLVKLADEIEAVRAYLDVETVRFGERLTRSIEVGAETENLGVLPGLLQPLVENAVNHGVAQLREGGCVSIETVRKNGRLRISVSNPDAGPSRHRGTGTSLADLTERLRLEYDDDAEVSSSSTDGRHEVALNFPARRFRR